MGQYELLDYLKKNPYKWFSSEELMEVFDLQQSSVTRSMRLLEKSKFISSEMRKSKKNRGDKGWYTKMVSYPRRGKIMTLDDLT